MKQFFTREQANEGIKLPLSLPDGTPTDYWIKIRGADSDEFRRAERDSIRKIVEIRNSSKGDTEALEKAHEEQETELVAALVIDWNMDEDGVPQECTKENVIEFLTNAPLIRDQINRAAANRRLFFVKGSNSSTSTPKRSSGSKKSRRGRNKA